MMDARERGAASTGGRCQENSLAEGRRKTTVAEGEKPETGTEPSWIFFMAEEEEEEEEEVERRSRRWRKSCTGVGAKIVVLHPMKWLYRFGYIHIFFLSFFLSFFFASMRF